MSPKTTPIAASVSAGSDDLRERLLASKEEERGLHEGAQANPAPHKMQPHDAFFAGALAKSRLMRSPSLSVRASRTFFTAGSALLNASTVRGSYRVPAPFTISAAAASIDFGSR